MGSFGKVWHRTLHKGTTTRNAEANGIQEKNESRIGSIIGGEEKKTGHGAKTRGRLCAIDSLSDECVWLEGGLEEERHWEKTKIGEGIKG